MDERNIIKHAQEGDREAFRTLFEENKNLIFSLAYRYTKNMEDAEDILQDTFIKAYHSLHTFQLQAAAFFLTSIPFAQTKDDARQIYEKAKSDIAKKNWEQAIANFENITKNFENSEYLAESFYWLGYSLSLIHI